jgi:putative intracellular protease/amidase
LIQSEDPSAAEDTKRFDKDTELKAKLKETHKLADVKESDYDAVFYPGGHGPLWDLATDKIQSFNCRFYSNNKPVAFVCQH